MEIQCGIETFGLSLYEESSFTQIMGWALPSVVGKVAQAGEGPIG